METDLSIRLHLYATAAERLARGDDPLCTDAISCWRSATASHSAAVVCSHTRILRGNSEPDPSRPSDDELDILIAGKHDKPATIDLPLPPGNNSTEILALGAEGVVILKGRNV